MKYGESIVETMNNSSSEATSNDQAAPHQCPDCGSSEIGTNHKRHEFKYGAGDEAVVLAAMVPFRTCHNCGLEFVDADGEELMHEAVCRHLGVFSPAEVADIIKRAGLSRAEFARLTGLGEASLARWVKGSSIQNKGCDSLLYLLTFPDNIARLKTPGFIEVLT